MTNVAELTPRWVQNAQREIRRLTSFLGGRGSCLQGATLADVEAFVSERGRPLAAGSVQNVIARLKALFRFLHLVGVRQDDLGAWLRYPSIDRLTQVPPILSPKRLTQIFQALAQRRDRMALRDFAIAVFLYTTAMRNGEAGALRIGDIDWAKRVVRIRHGKQDKERYVPLMWEGEQALRQYLATRPGAGPEELLFVSRFGRHLNPSDVGEIFKRWGERLGWQLRPHQLRHIAASHLLAAGVSIESIQTLLGHTSVTTSLLYARLRPEALAEQIHAHPLAAGTVRLTQEEMGWSAVKERGEAGVPKPQTDTLRGRVPDFAPVATPFGQEVEAFLTSAVTAARMRPATASGHRSGLRDLAAFLQQAGVDEVAAVRPKHLLAWLEAGRQRGLRANTLLRRMQAVRALFRRARFEGRIQADPTVGIRVAQQPAPERQALSLAQMEGLLAAPDRTTAEGYQAFIALLLLYATGLRAGEAQALQVGDLDLHAGWVRVREGKGGRVRDVPIPRQVLPVFRRWIGLRREGPLFLGAGGGPVGKSTLKGWVNRAGKRAGIPFRVGPHTIRHTLSVVSSAFRTCRFLHGHGFRDFEALTAYVVG